MSNLGMYMEMPQCENPLIKKDLYLRQISKKLTNFCVQVMIDVGLLTALFDYVKPNDSVCSVEWTSAQYEELQLQVCTKMSPLSFNN